jgi:hypothetical protein
LGSGIRKKFIPDPWGKKAPDPGSRIRSRNTDLRDQKYTIRIPTKCTPETHTVGNYLVQQKTEMAMVVRLSSWILEEGKINLLFHAGLDQNFSKFSFKIYFLIFFLITKGNKP